jgi:hypothetical protein
MEALWAPSALSLTLSASILPKVAGTETSTSAGGASGVEALEPAGLRLSVPETQTSRAATASRRRPGGSGPGPEKGPHPDCAGPP